MGDKMTEAEFNEYVSTFEETLQRFMGLSSEEIWELQRILLRRVRFKVSETLSPEGKTAMNQVKQDMLELATKKRVSSATLVSELIDLGSKQTEEAPREEARAVIVLVAADGSEMPADETNTSTDDKAADDTTDFTAVEKVIDGQAEAELKAKETENHLTETSGSVKETVENVKRAKGNTDQIADSEGQTNEAPAHSVKVVGSSDTGLQHDNTQPDQPDSVNEGVGSSHHEGLQRESVIGDKVGDTGGTSSGELQASKRNDVTSPGDVTSCSNVESKSHEGEGQERESSQDRINEQSPLTAETLVESETPNSFPS
ncbi:uncharacterized protein [Haliotis asinina]